MVVVWVHRKWEKDCEQEFGFQFQVFVHSWHLPGSDSNVVYFCFRTELQLNHILVYFEAW